MEDEEERMRITQMMFLLSSTFTAGIRNEMRSEESRVTITGSNVVSASLLSFTIGVKQVDSRLELMIGWRKREATLYGMRRSEKRADFYQ